MKKNRSSNPITTPVPGAPFQPGDRVTVVQLVDDEGNSTYCGVPGIVVHLEYECGCGQSYPGDPMIGVRFPDGFVEEYWKEELTS